MYSLSLDFFDRLRQGLTPICLLALTTSGGQRIYSTVSPDPDAYGFADVHLFDGSWTFDGSVKLGEGALQVLALRPFLLDAGRLVETLTPESSELFVSLTGQEITSVTLRLQNGLDSDGLPHFSKVEALEGFLSAEAVIRLAFAADQSDWLDRFAGRVARYELTRAELTLHLEAA